MVQDLGSRAVGYSRVVFTCATLALRVSDCIYISVYFVFLDSLPFPP
jgi:hypothetical protein